MTRDALVELLEAHKPQYLFDETMFNGKPSVRCGKPCGMYHGPVRFWAVHVAELVEKL